MRLPGENPFDFALPHLRGRSCFGRFFYFHLVKQQIANFSEERHRKCRRKANLALPHQLDGNKLSKGNGKESIALEKMGRMMG